jgi:hypothetical protein
MDPSASRANMFPPLQRTRSSVTECPEVGGMLPAEQHGCARKYSPSLGKSIPLRDNWNGTAPFYRRSRLKKFIGASGCLADAGRGLRRAFLLATEFPTCNECAKYLPAPPMNVALYSAQQRVLDVFKRHESARWSGDEPTRCPAADAQSAYRQASVSDRTLP